ncbi:MAG: hypothetical protein Q8K81_09150 [Sulfuricurvum sp.]|nr:hypothetical protein [Sulfuricurvum sp.]
MAETNNPYEVKLDEAKRSLQECQTSKALDSCLNCPSLIGCPIRTLYVRTVYESMSKGETGGFDF